MAYLEKAAYLLDTQIAFAERQLTAENRPAAKTLQWLGGSMELVELVYALHEAGCFGKTPLKTVFAVIGKAFGCEIANYSRLFWDVRNRAAEDRTFFLN